MDLLGEFRSWMSLFLTLTGRLSQILDIYNLTNARHWLSSGCKPPLCLPTKTKIEISRRSNVHFSAIPIKDG